MVPVPMISIGCSSLRLSGMTFPVQKHFGTRRVEDDDVIGVRERKDYTSTSAIGSTNLLQQLNRIYLTKVCVRMSYTIPPTR
jgi:hypothetical protein